MQCIRTRASSSGGMMHRKVSPHLEGKVKPAAGFFCKRERVQEQAVPLLPLILQLGTEWSESLSCHQKFIH